jgi:hypothetical protein
METTTQTNALRKLLKASSIFMSDEKVRKRLSRLYVEELRALMGMSQYSFTNKSSQ